jgi:hypothetical protein
MLACLRFNGPGCCNSSGASFAQQDPTAIFLEPLPGLVFANTGRHLF